MRIDIRHFFFHLHHHRHSSASFEVNSTTSTARARAGEQRRRGLAVSRRSGLLPPGIVQIATLDRVEANLVDEAKHCCFGVQRLLHSVHVPSPPPHAGDMSDYERRRAFSLFLMFFPRSLSTAQRGYAARCGGAYEGYFSNFRRAGFIWSHVCASDVHTSTCGLNQLGSSRLAALIATMSGCESVMTWIGEPQSGQKLRWVLPPASLGESWEYSEPWESLKASDGTMTKDEKGPPLDRWQSLQ